MNAGTAELEVLASRLRAQVAEGRYRDAQSTLQEYCRVLRKTAAGLPHGDPGWRCLNDAWRRLQEETRRRVLVRRAHACARLVRLPQVPMPYREPSRPRRTWECSA